MFSSLIKIYFFPNLSGDNDAHRFHIFVHQVHSWLCGVTIFLRFCCFITLDISILVLKLCPDFQTFTFEWFLIWGTNRDGFSDNGFHWSNWPNSCVVRPSQKAVDMELVTCLLKSLISNQLSSLVLSFIWFWQNVVFFAVLPHIHELSHIIFLPSHFTSTTSISLRADVGILYCYKLLCREHTILSSEEAEQINAGTHPPRTDNPNYGQLRVKGNLGELNFTST